MKIIFCNLVFLFFVISNVLAIDVAVVLSADYEPLLQVSMGFKSYLQEKGVPVKAVEYNLKRNDVSIVMNQINSLHSDIVLAIGSKAADAAKASITSIPVIFSMVVNPSQYTRPNSTGISMEIKEDIKLKEIDRIFPGRTRLGIIYSSTSAKEFDQIYSAASSMGFKVVGRKIDSAQNLLSAVKDISGLIDLFIMVVDNDIYNPLTVKGLFMESFKYNFPIVGLSSFFTKAGAVISFECNYQDVGRQAGEIAYDIINGKKPGSIKPSYPRTITYSINQMTAKKCGIDILPGILNKATSVFGK
ncbi:MAG: hypothetical protein A2X41_08385 [Candidatus Margulisbacteria bacterium GWE2_39_32]|nr:MAG: hypothetical protein A2X41_08385 [Candidatus Margulisbacteria bacterium GWE2_39_32]